MENLTVKIETGVETLVIREGAALPLREPQKITISGTIDAPAKFVAARKKLIDKDSTHVLYSRKDMRIILKMSEKDYYSDTIEGSLNHNPELLAFGINIEKYRSINELKSFLKLRRFFFPDKDAHGALIFSLEKFKAKVSTDIEREKDSRGNQKDLVDKQVDLTTLPEFFTLEIPIYIGLPSQTFRVSIGADITDGATKLYLESTELAELSLSLRDTTIDKELTAFSDYVIIEV